jgi:hypothetical protein
MLHPFITLPLIVLFICQEVIANTEIINFLAAGERNVDFSSTTVDSW